jgi:2-amino-4-hydroxy-6-hydroxymethyldihydropteridine diphosphokinase
MDPIESLNKAYLLTGGNIGNRAGYLQEAARQIDQTCGSILKSSSIYETAAWGKTDQQDFLNQAMLIETNLASIDLLEKILQIEKNLGRRREEKYGKRTIDIDILFYNREIINKPALQVPHPEMQNRRFTLVPLNEIAPEFIHPVFLKKIAELLKDCGDKLDVKKITREFEE